MFQSKRQSRAYNFTQFIHKNSLYISIAILTSLTPMSFANKTVIGSINRDYTVSSNGSVELQSANLDNESFEVSSSHLDQSNQTKNVNQYSQNINVLEQNSEDSLNRYGLNAISHYIAEQTETAVKNIISTDSVKEERYTKSSNKIILLVWDGLRRDVISQEHTPNLYNLKMKGSFFSDHHSSYPTVSMNNASSLATGNDAGATGFYGNKVWRPDIADLPGLELDFIQPVFTQNYSVLKGLQQVNRGKPLMYVETLLQRARRYGLITAQVGKAGPIALQDADTPSSSSIIISSDKVYPEYFAKQLQKKGYFIPQKAITLHQDSDLTLGEKNDDPTKKAAITELNTISGDIPLVGLSNPELALEARSDNSSHYFMDIYLKEILPNYKPDISIIWMEDPDMTEHAYGPGSKPFYTALENQDKLLGKLLLYIDKLGLADKINVIVASDHGHSNVAGDENLFPLRDINKDQIGGISQNGYSVSGYVRLADLLSKAGFNAFDGDGCQYNPVLHGIKSDGSLVASIDIDKDNMVCQQGIGALYTSRSYFVPKVLPEKSVIIANNSGSAYLYIPDGDRETVINIVRYLQSRQEIGSIFIDHLYGAVPGTLPLNLVNFYDDNQERHPDILVSMNYNDKAKVQGLPGIVYTTDNLDRGSHGTLSPIDISNVFIGYGPSFKTNYVDLLPTGNVDVPVTMAYIMNIPFGDRHGRPVLEALKGSGTKAGDYQVMFKQFQPDQPAVNLNIQSLTNLYGQEIVQDKDSYTFVLNTKKLVYRDQNYTYIDSAIAMRY